MKLTNPVKRFSLTCLGACALLLAACSGMQAAPTGTPTPLPSETATATTVWFPATDTPTFFATQFAAPTLDSPPGVGEMIYSDAFDQPAEWETSSSAQASSMVTRNRLVLSISEPGAAPFSMLSLRGEPVVGDFYAEASVDLSLCSGKDEYGMLVRAGSNADFYRYVVNCSGQVRLERVRAGVSYPLLDWLTSGDAPTGAPAQVKLGVRAAGRELRVYLNDHYQFSQSDPVFSSGTIGFFILSSGKTPVTVSFSDLSVYSVSYIPQAPTPVPSNTTVPTTSEGSESPTP